MVVEEPLLRLGVIVAMAAGGIVILLLMTLIMYACCKGYKGKLLPQRETQQGTVSAIYNPTILYRHEDTEVNRLQIQPPTPAETGETTLSTETEERDVTPPPPPYEEVACMPLPLQKATKRHDYSA